MADVVSTVLWVVTCVVLVASIVILLEAKRRQVDNSDLLKERSRLEQERDQKLRDIQELVEARAKAEGEIHERYKEYEKVLQEDYERKVAELDANYEVTAGEIQAHIDEMQARLDSLQSTRAAAIEAAKREREVADSPDTYSLSLSPQEESDVDYIESILPRLRYPEVLGKYVWSCYYQKKYKTLAANLLGTDPVCGIYKITDQLTQEGYVGQSLNVAKRWGEHMRAGCGATSSSKTNKLYDAMRRDGLSHFSFELLERCAPEDLDEKERFFIGLYSTDSLGLNSTSGNEKQN